MLSFHCFLSDNKKIIIKRKHQKSLIKILLQHLFSLTCLTRMLQTLLVIIKQKNFEYQLLET